MSGALRVEDGRRPWLPAANATPGEVFDHFNVPRSGLLHWSGLTYFYECIFGDGGPAGVWAYTHVTNQEVAWLLTADGPDEFDAVADHLITRGRWTVAAAGRDTIIYSTILDADGEGPNGFVDRLMERWDMAVRSHGELTQLIGAAPHVSRA